MLRKFSKSETRRGRDGIILGYAIVPGCVPSCCFSGLHERRWRPSVKAFSDSDGVLHVSGSGWKGCGRVAVGLPEPWTGSETTVGGNGRFSLMYAHPEVKPYKGAVIATCADSPKQRATTEIRVGDIRSQ
jgi:hypothetical protein